ncbi:hypothetical protein J6590_059290 [Homalodisca vitripennis]|nr:hypothetical protein J6590_059290 [Homalodisca vitripennis]
MTLRDFVLWERKGAREDQSIAFSEMMNPMSGISTVAGGKWFSTDVGFLISIPQQFSYLKQPRPQIVTHEVPNCWPSVSGSSLNEV